MVHDLPQPRSHLRLCEHVRIPSTEVDSYSAHALSARVKVSGHLLASARSFSTEMPWKVNAMSVTTPGEVTCSDIRATIEAFTGRAQMALLSHPPR